MEKYVILNLYSTVTICVHVLFQRLPDLGSAALASDLTALCIAAQLSQRGQIKKLFVVMFEPKASCPHPA